MLILTYYWPPSGGSGVQRWLKFVKYLPSFDIEPVVYTVDQAQYPILDERLLEEIPEEIEVLKQPIKEPNRWLAFFKKSSSISAGFIAKKPSFFGKVALYIRANYFIPDARKFWIKPSVRYLTDYILTHQIDLVISSGPPHSLHLIGQKLKENLGVKWIADFRDPWTQIDYFHQLPLSKRALEKHQYLEKGVLQTADRVLVVGDYMKEQYLPFTDKIDVITNGFDDIHLGRDLVLDTSFSLVHIGMLNADRDPISLWKALQALCKKETDFAENFSVKLIGKIAPEVVYSIKRYGLMPYVTIIPYVTHQEALRLQRQAQVLILAVNNVPSAKGIITGKVFEYLQAQRPILAIAPKDGDLAEIIENTGAGAVVGFDDVKFIETKLMAWFELFRQGELCLKSTSIDQYHRKNLTKSLAQIIRKLCTTPTR
ncbi:glycosyltransferase [Flavobacteriaceae bacterium F08102]|nr:glycosyltransferase [Flavobacteriaceae bacterium F08102]